jgi:hypothetical protein
VFLRRERRAPAGGVADRVLLSRLGLMGRNGPAAVFSFSFFLTSKAPNK